MSYADRMADWDIRKFIGYNIRRIRERADLPQEEFAKMLGTNQSTLSLWETGAQMPRLMELVGRLERAGLDPRDLVSPHEDPGSEVDPDIARAVGALRDLPRDARRAVATLADNLRATIPRDYDPESAELLRILGKVDPAARAGVLNGIRQLVDSFAPTKPSTLGIE